MEGPKSDIDNIWSIRPLKRSNLFRRVVGIVLLRINLLTLSPDVDFSFGIQEPFAILFT